MTGLECRGAFGESHFGDLEVVAGEAHAVQVHVEREAGDTVPAAHDQALAPQHPEIGEAVRERLGTSIDDTEGGARNGHFASGHDAQGGATGYRIEERGIDGKEGHVDAATRQQRDDLAGPHLDEVDIEPGLVEVAGLIGAIERGQTGLGRDADFEPRAAGLVRTARTARGGSQQSGQQVPPVEGGHEAPAVFPDILWARSRNRSSTTSFAETGRSANPSLTIQSR